jgi:hypothetical protein
MFSAANKHASNIARMAIYVGSSCFSAAKESLGKSVGRIFIWR